jgi:GntR family transcriptional regulator
MNYHNQPVPKYYKIYEDLLNQILEGQFRDNELFPSDTELVKKYGVSRGTVREAVKILFQQGYLVREQGKGTFVTYKKIQQDPDQLIGFTELMRQHNLKPSAKVIEKEVIYPPAHVSHMMHLKPDQKVVRIVRLRFGNNQPLIIERSFFNYDLFEPILSEDIENNSIFELLYELTETRLDNAKQCIEAISAAQLEHQLLEVESGTPLLLIKRLIQTKKEEYFQYSEDVYRSDRINFATETLPYNAGQDEIPLPFSITEQDLF